MSSREESYSGYPLWIVPLTGGPAPEPDTHPNAVRIYADENQDLRSLKSDGTDTPIGGGGSQTVLAAVTTLTPTQIKSLATTAVVVVDAPGDGKMIVPLSVVGALVFVSEAYVGGTPDNELCSSVDPGSQASFSWTGTAFQSLDFGSDRMEAEVLTQPTNIATTNVNNRPLAIFNFGDQYTNGDGLYTITVCYYVAHLS